MEILLLLIVIMMLWAVRRSVIKIQSKQSNVTEKETNGEERKSPKKATEIEHGTCARCGEAMVERNGKRGRFLGCSSYPKCRYTKEWYGKKEVAAIKKELRAYRKRTANQEGYKAFTIFSDAEMKLLLEAMPSSKEELLQVRGFGKVKVEKYGAEIIKILNQKNK